ncbi:MAG TPA: PAS domain S-box protein [Steroidobacteraceae bacterium]|nr:PAS domain S-box protein [Steroidobacteraceae bacterium]
MSECFSPSHSGPGLISGNSAVSRSLNRLLIDQVRIASADSPTGEPELARLLELVSKRYDAIDEERRGVVRSMQMMSDEAQALTREIREQTSSQLQAILDHIKDAIVTVDESGHIEMFNPTGERIFGYSQAEVLGLTLDHLIPESAEQGSVREYLERLAARLDDTHVDLAAHETWGRNKDGAKFAAEIAVSEARVQRRRVYVVCLRDITDRRQSEQALRDSEARYRTLVENAPEAIVVLDVDQGRFIDVNDNAVRFFRMDRATLLASGPEQVSPPAQADGTPSFGVARGYIDRALAGETPVFEWLHRDAMGTDIPCEVRLVRLPSSTLRLVRGSITDITERKRLELISVGERRVFEKLASHAHLSVALEAIAEVIEKVCADAYCCISLLNPQSQAFHQSIAIRLPSEFRAAMEGTPVGARYGSCAAAVYLGRQVIVADIAKDALWDERRELALKFGLRSCWSTPIVAGDGRALGTFAMYRKATGTPGRRDFELMARMTQLAGIAIERRRAESALRASEAKFRGLFENVMEGVYQTSRDGKFLSVNPALVTMLGYDSADELLALSAATDLYWSPEDRVECAARMEASGELHNAEFVLRRKDGKPLVVLESGRVMRDEHGEVVGYEGTFADITERKKAETAVFEEKERAQVTLQSIGDAVITTDAQGQVDYLNPVAESLTGWDNAEARGLQVTSIFTLLNETDREVVENPVVRCLREGRVTGLADHTVLMNRGGQEIAIQNSAAPIRDRNGSMIGAVMVFHDVSRERRLRRALSYQASHDALTGLINRREFEARLNAALQSTRRKDGARHVLLYLDLDQFKLVNDTCGHPAGDRLLKQITGLLQTRIRSSDTLARLGGDEFGILLSDCTPDQAMKIADTLRQAIRDYRFVWHDGALNVGVSIGIVEITPETESMAALMSAADVACYAAKDQGRNRVHVYQQDNVPERHREMQWVSRLTRACEEDRLELCFQPIVPIGDNRDTRRHYELLLRMRDEGGTLVHPIEFIPAAERYNVMPGIDRWVVHQAIASLAHQASSAEPPYTLAVNLSGTSLNDDHFLEFVISELAAHPLSDGAICFEITETAAVANLANVVYFMRELKARGCRFSLDDFGSGLSSFMYLKTLPVDYLKIDGQFVENVARDPIDRSMVEAIGQIGRAMKIQTIAERVETAEVLADLARLGVEYAQGFHVAEPRPLDAFPHERRPATPLRKLV